MQSSYQGVPGIQASLTLVDAQKVSDTRYAEHEVFKQPLQIADLIIYIVLAKELKRYCFDLG
ncbi:MAG: G3E family GTPase [Oleiphilaceae bacterium]|jgi:G3E family GTPase